METRIVKDMRRLGLGALLAALAIAFGFWMGPAQRALEGSADRKDAEVTAASGTATPVLLELFTSEGCSSCPAADALLQKYVDAAPLPGALVVGLGHHVTYWDRLGWRDRFSSEVLTERQERYGSALRIPSIYTPQMIVDGRAQLVGSDAKAARSAIEQAVARPHGSVAITLTPTATDRLAVAVTASEVPAITKGDHADIVVAVTEDGLSSNVRAGENRGHLLAHAAVVRRLKTLGEAIGEPATARGDVSLDAEWRRDGLKIVAFVQERSSRHVLATGVAPVQSARR
jgi:hypothetical protein